MNSDTKPTDPIAALSERIEWLETRLAYHERLVDSLNLTVTEQQATIDTITQRLREFASEHDNQVRADIEKPPHY